VTRGRLPQRAGSLGLNGGGTTAAVSPVKFRMDNRGSDGTGCFRIEVRTDIAELSDMSITGLRK